LRKPNYYRYRKNILEKYGINLSVPALMIDGISWKSLTDLANIKEPPEWALESGFVYEPKRWNGFVDATQYERAWLNSEIFNYRDFYLKNAVYENKCSYVS
jgi:hypothetical protein